MNRNTEAQYFVNIVTIMNDCFNELFEYVYPFVKALPTRDQKYLYQDIKLSDYEKLVCKCEEAKSLILQELEKLAQAREQYLEESYKHYEVLRATTNADLHKYALHESLGANPHYNFEQANEEGFFLSKLNYQTAFENLNKRLQELTNVMGNISDISIIKKYPCGQVFDAYMKIGKYPKLLSGVEKQFTKTYKKEDKLEK